MKCLQIELPSLHLEWHKENGSSQLSSVIRTNYPKPSALAVAALWRNAGVEVKAVDMKIRDQDCIIPYREFNFENGKMVASRMGIPFEKIINDIFWADVVSFSANPSSWSNIAIDFMNFVKKVNQNVRIVIGGTDAIFRSEYYLQNGADFVILSEGEEVVEEIVKIMERSETIVSEIRGLAYLCDGQVINGGIVRNCNLSKLPIQALDIFEKDIPLWNMNIEGYIPPEVSVPIGFLFITRGCNQSCEYCTTPQKYGKLRFRPFDDVISEIEVMRLYGIRTINIWDDSLSSLLKWGERDYLINIVRYLKHEGFAYEFSQGMVIKDLWDQVKDQPDYELISELYSHEIVDGRWVGCYGEYFPMEFLQVKETAGLVPKLMSYEKEIAVMRAILEQGIAWLTYSCIIGCPDDGIDEFDLAIQRLNEVTSIVESYGAKGLPTPFMYSYFPGARLWGNKTKQELTDYSIEEYPELYQLNATSHRTNKLSVLELMDAKDYLERNVLSNSQYEEWKQTGRYIWKK